MAQTHYQALQINENASLDVIKLAYLRLLNDAKDKLQDSPAFFKKEQSLKNAFQVLSSPALRQAYNRKLAKKREEIDNDSLPPPVCSTSIFSGFFTGLVFSRGFIISLFLVFIFFVGIRINANRIMEQEIIYTKHAYEKRKLADKLYAENVRQRNKTARLEMDAMYQRQKDDSERRRSVYKIRQMENAARQDRRRAELQERQNKAAAERQARVREENFARERRRNAEKKRQDEYAAKKRLQNTLRQIERTSQLERQNNTIKAYE